MKQREHEALDRFAVLNKLSLLGEAAFALERMLHARALPHIPL
jgi:uncharacterized protein with HEPN domain